MGLIISTHHTTHIKYLTRWFWGTGIWGKYFEQKKMTSTVTPSLTPVERKGTFITMGKCWWRLGVSKVVRASWMPSCLGNQSRETWPVPRSLARRTLSPFGCHSLPITYIHLILRNMRLLGPTATKQLHACIAASLVLPETPVRKILAREPSTALYSRLGYNHPRGNGNILETRLCPSLWLSDRWDNEPQEIEFPRSLMMGEGRLRPQRQPEKEIIYNSSDHLSGESGA